MKHISQVLKAPDLVGRIESLVVVVEELLVPLLRQESKNLLRVLR
ncbi:hypothetical protein EV651_106104 [Kribbella sp. VKM Ac-2571]|nr:hypothetical protein EV651_106104 [Kribbella sp. VKM Ac-2571]